MTSRPTRLLLCLALVVVLLAVSCGDDDPSSSPATTADAPATTATTEPTATTTEPPPATTATTEPMTDEEAVLATVDGFWTTLVESSQPPDTDHPGLDQFLTGEQLTVTLNRIEEKQQLGQATRLPEPARYAHTSDVVAVDGDTARVSDCGVDDLILFDVASGMVLNDRVSTTLWELHLTRVDGTWKVSESLIDDQWEGVAGCAAE